MNIQELHNRLIKKASVRTDAFRTLMREFLKDPKEAQILMATAGKRSAKKLPLLEATIQDKTILSQLQDLFFRFDDKLKYHQKKQGFGGEGIKNVPGILSIKPNTINRLNTPIKGFDNKQLKNIAEIVNTLRQHSI